MWLAAGVPFLFALIGETAAQEIQVDATGSFPTAKEETSPSSCDKNAFGNDVDVAFKGPPYCANCRSFEAQESDGSACGPGWDLRYKLGGDRASVTVNACFDNNVLIIEMSAEGDQSAFSSAERSFFSRLADNIEKTTTIDTSIKGSLDALAIDASRALEDWPDGEFPINFYWPDPIRNVSWFDPDLLIRKDRCAFFPVDSGGGEAQIPGSKNPPSLLLVPPAPGFPPTDCVHFCRLSGQFNDEGRRFFRAVASCISSAEVQSQLSTHGCDWLNDGGSCDCTSGLDGAMFDRCRNPTTCPPFNSGRLDQDGIVQDDSVCTHICHVSSNGVALSLQPQCLEPSMAALDLNDHPCDYEISPDCACDFGATFETVQGCAHSCPDDATARLNTDGTLRSLVPTFAPTDCILVCHIEYFITADGDITVNVYPHCKTPANVVSDLDENECDWIIERDECDCVTHSIDQTMLDSCSPISCPIRSNGNTLAPTMTPIRICHLQFTSSDQVLVEERPYASLEDANADHAGHTCDWILTDTCGCIEDGVFDVTLIDRCAPDSCPQKRGVRKLVYKPA